MAHIYLSIGSNIEPAFHFQQCARSLQENFRNPVWSPVYRSAAVGMQADDFLNAVVEASTEHTIESTLRLLRKIEQKHGRVRTTNKFSSRTLDIDLLLYDDIAIDSAAFTLPRPELTTAAYVLKPLADLVPDGVHPVLEKTYDTLLQELNDANPERLSSLSLVNMQLGT